MDDVDVIRFVAMDTISKKAYHRSEDVESEEITKGSVASEGLRGIEKVAPQFPF